MTHPPSDQPGNPSGVCVTCGQEHLPRRCPGHVEECPVCGWRGRQRAGAPCRNPRGECDGVVILRPCRNYPLKGGKACENHGGRAPQVAAAAERRLEVADAERRIGAAFVAEGEHPQRLDPLEQVKWLIWRARRAVDALDAGVAMLDALYGPDHTGDGRPHVLVAMRAEWMDRLHRYSADAVKLGLEERQVRIDEQTGGELALVLQGTAAGALLAMVAAMEALGMAADVVLQVRERVASELPAIVASEIERVAGPDAGGSAGGVGGDR